MMIFQRNLIKSIINPSNKCLTGLATYKSKIGLETLYPDSSLKITTPSKPLFTAKFNGYIPINQLQITYSKSSCPGGQNVNKVNTKVEIRFNLENANWIQETIKDRLLEKFGNKLTKDGFLIVRSDLTRSQQLNLADCLEKVRRIIWNCLEEDTSPSPETLDRIRRRLEKQTRERLALKKHRSSIKSDRQAPILD